MARPGGARKRRLKAALAARDGAQCFYCGLPFPVLMLATMDHLVPQSLMPGWCQANLVLACRACNEAKAGLLPQVFLRRAGLVPSRRPVDRVRPVTVRSWVAGWWAWLTYRAVAYPVRPARPAA